MLNGQIPLNGRVPLSAVFAGVKPAHPTCVEARAVVLPGGGQALLVVERDRTRPLQGIWTDAEPSLAELRTVCDQWPMQAVLLVAEARGGDAIHLRVERNASATCPLYALVRGATLHLHWDGGQLYPLLDSGDDLDPAACRTFLMAKGFYRERTPFKHILRLLDRSVLEVSPDTGARIIRPPALAAPEACPLVPGADPVAKLQDLLQGALRRWPVSDTNTFCELSSGLDTTLIAHLLAMQVHPAKVKTCGYIPLGPDAPAIEARRQDTVTRLGAQDYCPSIAAYFPLAFRPENRDDPCWPFDAPTRFDKLASGSWMAQQGGALVFSGIGGDELCDLSEKERDQETASRRFKRVQYNTLTPASLLKGEDPVLDLPRWPAGLVPESAHEVAHAIAPLYLRHGLWYAHPLTLPEIQVFCHFLPVSWRQKRHISREILRRMGRSEDFLRQEPKESLGVALDTLMRDEAVFGRLFNESILLDLGILDGDKLRAAYQQLREGRAHERTGFHLTLAFNLECCLKSLRHHQRPTLPETGLALTERCG